jgi:hypothetical protein
VEASLNPTPPTPQIILTPSPPFETTLKYGTSSLKNPWISYTLIRFDMRNVDEIKLSYKTKCYTCIYKGIFLKCCKENMP